VLFQNNELNLFEANAWSPFNYVGLQLNVPIFKQNATRYKKQEYRLRQQIGMNTFKEQQQEILYEIESARTDLLNAQSNYQYAQENYIMAGKIYQTNLVKYEAGRLLYTELLDVEKSLTDAEDNLLTSTYDLLLAKVNWQKARGE
jgi:outer membrane protein TolC